MEQNLSTDDTQELGGQIGTESRSGHVGGK